MKFETLRIHFSMTFSGRGGGGGVGDSHMKGAEMLVVLLRGVNFRFWSRLGFKMIAFSGQKKVGPRPLWSPLSRLIQNFRRALSFGSTPPLPPRPRQGFSVCCHPEILIGALIYLQKFESGNK